MRLVLLIVVMATPSLTAQTPQQPDWSTLEAETMRHFQALLRFDTSDPPATPPGGEKPAAEYLKEVFDKEGIPAQLLALEPNRPNVVARLKGNGSKRPLLLMGHMDVVNVDAKKWTHPPFSATRQGGYVYGRGAVDDKDNVVAVLMVMLTLKRSNIPLDRDVIALFEAGEEGTTRVGIQFMVNQHFPSIDAEFCLAEGGNVTRQDGAVKFASIQTLEKIPAASRLRHEAHLDTGQYHCSRTPLCIYQTQWQRSESGHRPFDPTRQRRRTSNDWRSFRRPTRLSAIGMS